MFFDLSDEDKYEPQEKRVAKYNALQMVNKNCKPFDCYTIICFKVNESQDIPFLSFLLIQKKEFFFPSISNRYFISDIVVLENMVKCHLFPYLQEENFEKCKKNMKFCGVFEYQNEGYIFVDITNIETQTNKITYKKDISWFVLPDEIVNQKHVCNIPVANDVTHFFLHCSQFLFLHDEKDKPYEVPTVVYTSEEERNLYFRHIFGRIKTNKETLFGNQFYFTNFENAISEATKSEATKSETLSGTKKSETLSETLSGTKKSETLSETLSGTKKSETLSETLSGTKKSETLSETKKSEATKSETLSETKKSETLSETTKSETKSKEKVKYGLLRHAIFLGNCLYKENKPKDSYDTSNTKKRLLETNAKERMTVRITDYDGSWEDKYDSIFLGKVELDNGEIMKNTPLYVVKEYKNQVSLTCHYIDDIQ